MPSAQLGMFGVDQPSLEELLPVGFDQLPADFVERIRRELRDTLATARRAERLPWADLTRATLAELRFNSIARWLPAEEAAELRAAFEAELVRLYEAEDALRGE
jgi:hypothetical protein